MLGWLNGLIGLFTGALSQLWDDVISVIRAVTGNLQDQLNNERNWSNSIYAGLFRLSDFTVRFINGTFSPFASWAAQGLYNLSVAIQNTRVDLQNRINDVRNFAANGISDARGYAGSLFGNLTKWIISTIFGPLSHDIATALNWILHEGAQLLDLVLHPDKLLKLMWAFIFGQWVRWTLQFGPIIAAWTVHNWKKILPVFMTVLEDIIAHVLLGVRHASETSINVGN